MEIKAFNSSSKQVKNNFIKEIINKPVQQRTPVEKHIVKFNTVLPEKAVTNYNSIEE